MALIGGHAIAVSREMQATTKVLWTSMPQQILYTIFKAIGTPFRTKWFNKDYREKRH
jgi:hypothetical protein